MVVGVHARELQVYLARLRVLGSELLSFDAFERWGPRDGAAQAEAAAEAGRADAERREVQAALLRRVAELRVTDPAAIETWARAHQRLLDAYLAGLPSGDAKGTERHVATKERAEWDEVARGERTHVDQNVFYVRYDEALYEELFGPPSEAPPTAEG